MLPSRHAGITVVSRTERKALPMSSSPVVVAGENTAIAVRRYARRAGPGSHDVHDLWKTKKPPALRPGAVVDAPGWSLAADLQAGGGATSGAHVGDPLHPLRVVRLVVRSGVGLAQGIEAVHRRARGCGVEPRQLEVHPGAGIQFRQTEVHR